MTSVHPRKPTESIWQFAARIIQRADRSHPVDDIMRVEFKKQRGPSRESSGVIAQAVFAYYRWLGWLDTTQRLEKQVRQATEFAERFKTAPASFTDAELCAKAVPLWTQDVMDVRADWVRALQTDPTLWLRARPGEAATLAHKLGDCRPATNTLLTDALRYEGRQDLFRTPEFHRGEFELQDIASQAVGWLCAPQPGEAWWDACAGEGGKTLHLSDLMQNRGLIWATDRAMWRLEKLKRRAARARVFNYRMAHWDGSERLPTRTKFDGILVDAPCAGLGTWQRNPQARWTTTREDVEELAEVQRNLLVNAASALRPGGRLIYAVCTLTRPETVVVRDSIESLHLSPLPVTNPFQPESAPASELWFRPHEINGNGMFVAAWRKRTA